MSNTTNEFKLIRCPSCGASITIEGDSCPYCGMLKVQFEEYRRRMGAFNQDYQSVRKSVVEENRKTGRKTTYAAILLVLTVVFLLEVLVSTRSYDLVMTVKDIFGGMNMKEHVAMLDYYETEKDFEGFDTYYTENINYKMSKKPALSEYELLKRYAGYYKMFVDSIVYVAFPEYGKDNSYRQDNCVDNLVEYYNELCDMEQECILSDEGYYFLDDSVRNEKHMQNYALINERADLMMINLLGFTEEELEDYKELSEVKQKAIIIEKYLQFREAPTDELL